MNVLIIEDEPAHMLMLKARLKAAGFKVISSEEGELGIKKACREKPDCILLDLLIPKQDGY